jgi:hypothetical protein
MDESLVFKQDQVEAFLIGSITYRKIIQQGASKISTIFNRIAMDLEVVQALV